MEANSVITLGIQTVVYFDAESDPSSASSFPYGSIIVYKDSYVKKIGFDFDVCRIWYKVRNKEKHYKPISPDNENLMRLVDDIYSGDWKGGRILYDDEKELMIYYPNHKKSSVNLEMMYSKIKWYGLYGWS